MAYVSTIAELKKAIEAFDNQLSNFKKQGKDRLTAEYVISNLSSMKEKWDGMKKLNDKISAFPDFLSSSYAKKGEFRSVLKRVKDFVKALRDVREKKPELLEEILVTEEELKLIESEMEKAEIEVANVMKKIADGENGDGEGEILNNHLHVKLPKLELPKFTGDIRKWRNFFDMFTKLVHEKKELSEIEKFTFLRNYLEGEPLNLISHFDVSAATYNIAYTTLQERYNNERWLIDAEVDFLLEGKMTTIRELHDHTREALYNLKALKVDTATWDALLVRITMKKLDKKTISAFEDTLAETKKTPSLETLLKFLEKRFHRLDQVKLITDKRDERASGGERKRKGQLIQIPRRLVHSQKR